MRKNKRLPAQSAEQRSGNLHDPGEALLFPERVHCPQCTRRHFIAAAAVSGAGLAAASLLRPGRAFAFERVAPAPPGATGERIAAAEGSWYRAYRSQSSAIPAVTTWVQIDLGSSQPIDAVKLYPAKSHMISGEGFPLRFLIECSDDSAFQTRQLIADQSKADYPDPEDRIVQFTARRSKGRYVRVSTTRLRPNKVPSLFSFLPKSAMELAEKAVHTSYVFALAKVEVLSGAKDIALRSPVSVDTSFGNSADAQQLTRALRPQGETLTTDNPRNVTPANQWHPAQYRAQAPHAGVHLRDDLFMKAMQDATAYLLDSYSVDDLLREFRARAGRALPASSRKPNPFWEDALAGSNAGRFLMGAANALRWTENAQLRARMNAVVAGIADCRQPNGYIMAYPEDTFFVSERGAYTRAWLTHGLLDAGYAGNPQAFELLRGYYDWYNSRPYLKEMLRGAIQGGQGMVANSRLYFSPVGKPADIQVLQRYFQENYWLDDLAARRVDAVWQYPYDRPHSYLLTNLEAYLDLYRATGDRRYLDAVLGAWELYRENWQSIGGSFFIIELEKNEPKSYPLYDALGETCGSAFWILLNHRLHLLDPGEEKYVAEIEKSIYNVVLANQSGSQGIRYHTKLVGHKEAPQRVNTCCEGQAIRLIGSLPQFIYSTAEDGLFVNLFEASSFEWTHSGEVVHVEMQTEFPKRPGVRLRVRPSKPVDAKIRIRTPSWASGVMSIAVNGKLAATGTPGSYVTLDRSWSAGDEITFVLPIAFKLSKYTGVDRIEGRDRFYLEYGPILMAALGDPAETELVLRGASRPLDLLERLQPVAGRPLHFSVSNPLGSAAEFAPYYKLDTESFSCAPFVEVKAGIV